MPAGSRLPTPLRVLVGTQFGLYYTGNGLSLVGIWMQRIACGWLVWSWTHSAFWLGILAAGDLLPVVAIGPLAGVAADRWNRLRQNILAQAALALLATAVAWLLATDRLGLLGLVLLTAAQGTLTAVIQPARLAMVQQMVPREDLATAVALNSVNINLARLLGPAIAGAMILQFSIVWVFVANAVANLVFVLVLLRLRLAPQHRHAGSQGFVQEMAEGFRYILGARALCLIMLAMFCGGSMVRAIVELMPAIAAQTFAPGATGLAMLTSAAAAGAVLSGLTLRPGPPAGMLDRVLLCWGLGALMAAVLVHASSQAVAVAAAVAVGASITRGLVSTQTFVQLATPDRLRGRVLSVHGLIARGSPALGALLLGGAADRFGLARAATVSCGLLVVVLLALLRPARAAARELRDLS
ncbi:MFS transporter [Pseudorhodoferax sp.]|uniref:MFS transporter n=1 Tax=Pseudorhodoferax sp. TaxID=1993553 RepID=UPI002DD661AF|nr:MFS transporter [Pseudorhodoferax sp.]